MASTVNTGSTVGHHLASKILITLQSFVILSLTYWIVEEYLNNMYLRLYVSDVFQAEGLVFVIIAMLLVLGSGMGLFVKHRHGSSSVSLEIKTPSPVVRSTAKAVKQESKKPADTDLHPAVAALKADMADRRLSFGSFGASGNEREQASPSAASAQGVQKTSVLDQLTANRPLSTMAPMQGQTRPQFPQSASHDHGAPGATRPRDDQQVPLLSHRPIPVLRSDQPVGSSVLQPPQRPPAPQLPANVTTVITGIMPVQKKKDPTAPSEEKSSSSQ